MTFGQFQFPFGDEEAMKRFQEEQRIHMASHEIEEFEAKHNLRRVVDSLNDEQLELVLHFMNAIYSVPNPSAQAAYYMGWLSEIRGSKSGKCPVCMQDKHDLVVHDKTDMSPPHTTTVSAQDLVDSLAADEVEVGIPDSMIQVKELMDQYNVNEVADSMMVVCKGCGQTYQSLTDRMLSEPDNCKGCHEKSAWGG